MLEARIEITSTRKLVGLQREMSISDDHTFELWSSFGPRIREIPNRLNADRINMQLYGPDFFEHYDPTLPFLKCATVEVTDFSSVPDGMLTYEIPSGEYAVFDYKGSSRDYSIFTYIIRDWLPLSPYIIDHRPHFQVLGDKFNIVDDQSEEEIWLPIKNRDMD